ncbi:MAG TPA: CAP domain-containing protein [Albitalea sp.]|nr:CAP domain-containing protein [Albitalea sp.]
MPTLRPFIVATLTALCVPAAPLAQIRPDAAEVSRQIVAQTNQFRRSQGLAPTAAQPELAEAARYFANYMARTDRYGHEADGSQASQRARAHGYDYCMVSENIAYQYHSGGFKTQDLARGMVEGWKNSPDHRHNMLDPDASDTAVALAQSPRTGRWYAVQMFGRPQASRFEFRIANRSTTPLRYEVGGESFQLPPRVTRTHEQCRVETLTLRLPGEPEAVSIRPGAGERYAVERVGSRLRLTKS